MKYGDAVVLVTKSADGTLRRANAIVLASNLHVPTTADRKPILGADNKPVAAVEHLDLAFPVTSLAPDGGAPKTRNMDEIFRPAHDVAPYREGAWSGYEVAEEEDDRINGSPREVVLQQFAEASEVIARLRKDLSDANSALTAERAKCGSALGEVASLKKQLAAKAAKPATP